MIDTTAQQTQDPPPPDPIESEQVEAPLSIADHAAQYGPGAKRDPAEETAEQKEAREHHSAQQRRDKENGQFKDGKVRHRAKSQQAGPEDVPRIQALTARAKTAEDRATAAEAELARLKAVGAPAAQIAKAEAKVETTAAAVTDDPEPQQSDAVFAEDYGKYLEAHARWAARDEWRQQQQKAEAASQQAARETAEQAVMRTFGERIEKAKEKYTDFETVAFGPTRIPQGGPIDAWILEDESGPDVLYHLQSHPQELDSLLAVSALEQLKRLTLLSQRLLSPPSAQAGTTGSAAGRQSIVSPPRPPNPVRTEAQRASDGPPPLDGSLSITGHAKAFYRR